MNKTNSENQSINSKRQDDFDIIGKTNNMAFFYTIRYTLSIFSLNISYYSVST